MGFDIECIIDIQTYPGEYFCPVCRTLVYPNEALQSQCSHLYCKPCLVHIANGSKACPYDGYLVTETDSKPLIESDKALVEKIGKVKVHCLYFRSGCTWEGTLSDCTSHSSECTYGNSPVICNRCGIQIVHRQVHDHAQSCPGVYGAQPAVGVVPGATSSVTVSAANTTDLNQTVAHSGPSLSQSQNPQNANVSQLPVQNPNQPSVVNPQAAVVAPVSMPTTEQWYQQQYQNYYQQYGAYNPYQHPQQQYYSLQQQQPFQQYQQTPLPVQSQPQAQPSSQLPAQSQPLPLAQPPPQVQVQPQAQHIFQTQQQPNFQQLAQGPAQPLPVAPQAVPHVQVQPQGQPQLRPPIQALTPNYQVNPQQQPPPLMRTQAQVPTQFPQPPPHSQPPQPPSYAQTVGPQLAAQHPQVHQAPLQMQHSHVLQAHLQPQMHAQSQFQNQISNQSHLQIQQEAPLFHNQYSQVRPPPNQPIFTAALSQPSNLPASNVSGHHSFPQPQPVEQIQSGTSQQHPMHLHPASGPLHPAKVQGLVSQPPSMIRPPSHSSLPLQSTFVPLHTQVPGIPLVHQQISTHAQPPVHNAQHGINTQTVQQAVPMQIPQHQPFLAPSKGHLHQQHKFPQQQSLQPQLLPYSSNQSMQSLRPGISNDGMHPQSSVGFGATIHAVPIQLGSSLIPNQNFVISAVLERKDSSSNTRVSEESLPNQELIEKDGTRVNAEPSKEETLLMNKSGLDKTVSRDRMMDENIRGAPEKFSGAISFETGTADVKGFGENSRSGDISHIPQQVDHESQREPVAMGPSSKEFDKVHHIPFASPEAPAKENISSVVGPQESGILSQSGKPIPHNAKPNSGRVPGYFGHQPRRFESTTAPQGSQMSTPDDSLGNIGKKPQSSLDGLSGFPDPFRSGEALKLKDQQDCSSYLSGSGEKIPLRETYGNEPSFRGTNGETDNDSFKFGFRDHLNQISMQPTRPLDQASRPLDKAPPRSSYEAGTKPNSGVLDPLSRFLPPHHSSGLHNHIDAMGKNTEFGRQIKQFPSINQDGDYLRMPPYGFGGHSNFPHGNSAFDDINGGGAQKFAEGSRSFNLPSDPVGHSFNDRRFSNVPGHLRGGEIGGPKNFGFGEHMTRGPLHHFRTDDVIGKDGSVPFARGEFSGPGYFSGHFMSEASGPGIFSGQSRLGGLGGQGNFHDKMPFNESIRGDRPGVPPFGDPSIRGKHPIPGFPNSGSFIGELDSFDQPWKRKTISMGWCRICKFDCDTVEGLEMHSQAGEHQKMAMDMVKMIKQNNKKKQRTLTGHVAHDAGSRSRKVGVNGRGNKF